MSTLGYRQGSGEAIPAIIHPSCVAGGQTWTVLSGVKKDVLNTVLVNKETCDSPLPVRAPELRIFSSLDPSPDPRSQLPQTTFQPSSQTIEQKPFGEPDETVDEANDQTSDREVHQKGETRSLRLPKFHRCPSVCKLLAFSDV